MQLLLFSIILLIFLFLVPGIIKSSKKGTENNTKTTDVYIDGDLASPVNEDAVSPQNEIESVFDPELLSEDKKLIDIEEERKIGNFTFRVRRFCIQKEGLNEAECEDKNALTSKNNKILRIAIADGATESLFSDIWADILVNAYTDKGADIFKSSELELLNKNFSDVTSNHILQMPETRQWYMYEKLERGTHATLAGAEFSSSDKMAILTIGDSCVFWSDGNTEQINMLPEITAEEFGISPNSICHLPKSWQTLDRNILRKEIKLEENLQMVLCTDALACWLVTDLETISFNWKKLFEISDHSLFANFIETLRKQNNIRNDDVTLVLINVLPFNV